MVPCHQIAELPLFAAFDIAAQGVMHTHVDLEGITDITRSRSCISGTCSGDGADQNGHGELHLKAPTCGTHQDWPSQTASLRYRTSLGPSVRLGQKTKLVQYGVSAVVHTWAFHVRCQALSAHCF